MLKFLIPFYKMKQIRWLKLNWKFLRTTVVTPVVILGISFIFSLLTRSPIALNLSSGVRIIIMQLKNSSWINLSLGSFALFMPLLSTKPYLSQMILFIYPRSTKKKTSYISSKSLQPRVRKPFWSHVKILIVRCYSGFHHSRWITLCIAFPCLAADS